MGADSVSEPGVEAGAPALAVAEEEVRGGAVGAGGGGLVRPGDGDDEE